MTRNRKGNDQTSTQAATTTTSNGQLFTSTHYSLLRTMETEIDASGKYRTSTGWQKYPIETERTIPTIKRERTIKVQVGTDDNDKPVMRELPDLFSPIVKDDKGQPVIVDVIWPEERYAQASEIQWEQASAKIKVWSNGTIGKYSRARIGKGKGKNSPLQDNANSTFTDPRTGQQRKVKTFVVNTTGGKRVYVNLFDLEHSIRQNSGRDLSNNPQIRMIDATDAECQIVKAVLSAHLSKALTAAGLPADADTLARLIRLETYKERKERTGSNGTDNDNGTAAQQDNDDETDDETDETDDDSTEEETEEETEETEETGA